MEKYVQEGDDVIDVGCGSGILAIGARLLGAGKIVGVDTDQKSIEITYRNAKVNGITDELYFHHGSSVRVVGWYL